MTPEALTEDSDDPEWLRQISLSLLVGVGPYFVHTNNQDRTVGSYTQAAHVSRKDPQVQMKAIALSGMPYMDPVYPDPPQTPKSDKQPGGMNTASALPRVGFHELSAQISAQINQPASTPAAPTHIYSYGSMAFVWQPNTATTFSSLPRVWACITMRESSDMVRRSNPASSAKGAFQIKSFMWAKYAPTGYPSDPNYATLSQQYRVALRIFRADGFAEWETHALCGV